MQSLSKFGEFVQPSVRSCRHEGRISEYSQCPLYIVTRVAQSLQRRWPIGVIQIMEPEPYA
jgi:hypothetical protein